MPIFINYSTTAIIFLDRSIPISFNKLSPETNLPCPVTMMELCKTRMFRIHPARH